MKKLASIAVMLMLIGCCASKKATVSETTTVKDSTVVTWTPIDTIIHTPEERLRLIKPVNEITQKATIKKGKRTAITVTQANDVLTIDCTSDALDQKIRLMQKQIDRYKEQLTRREETIIQEVKYTPWYAKILAWIGGIFLLYLLIRLGIKFIKPV